MATTLQWVPDTLKCVCILPAKLPSLNIIASLLRRAPLRVQVKSDQDRAHRSALSNQHHHGCSLTEVQLRTVKFKLMGRVELFGRFVFTAQNSLPAIAHRSGRIKKLGASFLAPNKHTYWT